MTRYSVDHEMNGPWEEMRKKRLGVKQDILDLVFPNITSGDQHEICKIMEKLVDNIEDLLMLDLKIKYNQLHAETTYLQKDMLLRDGWTEEHIECLPKLGSFYAIHTPDIDRKFVD